MDIASDDFLYPVRRTGKRGRPVNTGSRDFHLLYEMCARLAADPDLNQADAARSVAPASDYNAYDRLPRKLRRHPRMLEMAKTRHELQVERFIAEAKRRQLEASWLGFKSKASAVGYLQTTGLITADIWRNPRVIAAADAFWRRVRPGLVERLLEDHRRVERMMGLESIDRAGSWGTLKAPIHPYGER